MLILRAKFSHIKGQNRSQWYWVVLVFEEKTVYIDGIIVKIVGYIVSIIFGHQICQCQVERIWSGFLPVTGQVLRLFYSLQNGPNFLALGPFGQNNNCCTFAHNRVTINMVVLLFSQTLHCRTNVPSRDFLGAHANLF